MNKIIIAVILVLLLAGCGAKQSASNSQGTVVKTDKGQYTDISAAQLNEMLKNKDFVFVNVHIPFEGDIAGTDLSIPYDTITQNLDKLPADKNAKIVLYCRSDRMSNIAAREMADLGYTNLYNLDGGMVDWESAGFAIQR
jgi:rhodanese-related sulfurtransferase